MDNEKKVELTMHPTLTEETKRKPISNKERRATYENRYLHYTFFQKPSIVAVGVPTVTVKAIPTVIAEALDVEVVNGVIVDGANFEDLACKLEWDIESEHIDKDGNLNYSTFDELYELYDCITPSRMICTDATLTKWDEISVYWRLDEERVDWTITYNGVEYRLSRDPWLKAGQEFIHRQDNTYYAHAMPLAVARAMILKGDDPDDSCSYATLEWDIHAEIYAKYFDEHGEVKCSPLPTLGKLIDMDRPTRCRIRGDVLALWDWLAPEWHDDKD